MQFFFFLLSCDQCQYKLFDGNNSRVDQPICNLRQDFRVRLESVVESRCINEDNGFADIMM
jgi:hypothetical protein